MEKLKPCPLCGSNFLSIGKSVSCKTPKIIRYFRAIFPHGVTCVNCGYHKATISGWNRRADNGMDKR